MNLILILFIKLFVPNSNVEARAIRRLGLLTTAHRCLHGTNH